LASISDDELLPGDLEPGERKPLRANILAKLGLTVSILTAGVLMSLHVEILEVVDVLK
jgi:hypothetical protein